MYLLQLWYHSTSTCFHVYSREYTCSACCHEFWTSLTRVILGQNWYSFTGTCHHVKSSWFHSKRGSTHQICSQNLVNSRELSQLNSWIHLQNMWNNGSLFAGPSQLEDRYTNSGTLNTLTHWHPKRCMSHEQLVAEITQRCHLARGWPHSLSTGDFIGWR